MIKIHGVTKKKAIYLIALHLIIRSMLLKLRAAAASLIVKHIFGSAHNIPFFAPE